LLGIGNLDRVVLHGLVDDPAAPGRDDSRMLKEPTTRSRESKLDQVIEAPPRLACICPNHDVPCHRKRRPHRRLCSGCIDYC